MALRLRQVAGLVIALSCAQILMAAVGGTYETVEGDQILRFRSGSEIELEEEDSPIILGRYSIEPDGKVRVVAEVLGTTVVGYYRVTDEGLVDETDGTILYSDTRIGQAREDHYCKELSEAAERVGKSSARYLSARVVEDAYIYETDERGSTPRSSFRITGIKNEYFFIVGEHEHCSKAVILDSRVADDEASWVSREQGATRFETVASQAKEDSEIRASLLPKSNAVMVFTGESRMGRDVWPFTLRLTREESGAAEGEIEWLTEGSVHRVEGTFEGDTLVFKEVEYIKKGKATIGAKYTLTPTGDGEMEGRWKYTIYKGTISMKPARE